MHYFYFYVSISPKVAEANLGPLQHSWLQSAGVQTKSNKQDITRPFAKGLPSFRSLRQLQHGSCHASVALLESNVLSVSRACTVRTLNVFNSAEVWLMILVIACNTRRELIQYCKCKRSTLYAKWALRWRDTCGDPAKKSGWKNGNAGCQK